MPASDHATLDSLNNDERRALVLLTPLLRIADNLDRSREQDVKLAACEIQAGRVLLTLRSPREPDLAEWAASRVSDVFREVYGRGVELTHERG